MAAASVFGFLLLWCFFSVAGFAADASAARAAVAGLARWQQQPERPALPWWPKANMERQSVRQRPRQQ